MRQLLLAGRWAIWQAVLCALPLITGAAQGNHIRDSAGIRLVTSASQLRLPPPFTVDEVQSAAYGRGLVELIGGAHRFEDGRLLVADQLNARMTYFDREGRVLGTIGRRGAGEGDFHSLSRVVSGDNARALVWDGGKNQLNELDAGRRLRRIVRFERPGRQREAAPPRLDLLGRFADGQYLGELKPTQIGGDTSGVYQRYGTLVRYQSNGRFTDSVKSLQGGLYFVVRAGPIISGDLPFAPQVVVVTSRASFYLSDGKDYEIREFSPAGALLKVIRLDERPPPVSADLIAAYKAAVISRQQPAGRGIWTSALEAIPFPRMRDAYSDLHVDPALNLWARRSTIDGLKAHWDVFGPDGQYRGPVEFPADAQVLRIGRDEVLARVTTGAVEEVRSYPLRPSTGQR